ncbi:MAG: polyphosphate kinase 1 [Candidatus Kapaibacterium sp.]|nr:polyphosphate kinase 1 [Bacteroidota bacterium]
MSALPLVPRDISWLLFNERVLQEAADTSVPLVERMKFLGIYSSNGDEFFRVRVATLLRMVKYKRKNNQLKEFNPEELLEQIQRIVLQQQERFTEIYDSICSELEKQGLQIINETQLDESEQKYIREYFRQHVLPTLSPVLIDTKKNIPELKDRTIYLLVRLVTKSKGKAKTVTEKVRHALIEVSTKVQSRFVVLPKGNHIILLDDVIRYCINDLFYAFEFDEAKAYTIKITRDAELDIVDDVTKSLVRKIEDSLKRRKKGQPTRLVYDEELPLESLDFMLRKLKLKKDDTILPGGRYHNFVDFMNFPPIGPAALKFPSIRPIIPKEFIGAKSFLSVIKKQDVLLTYPYQSFDLIIHTIREAAIDPKVKSISITLYRVAKNSNIVNALVSALRNGKKVTCVVELQARFDEENNIVAANKLIEEGAKIIYGVPGLKAHSKLFLITRAENGKTVQYAHIGTGNFNESTAKIYGDHSLLTTDKRITDEVKTIFEFYNNNYKTGSYKHLLVSPFYMRKKFLALIDNEISIAKAGSKASIDIKLNSITDEVMIAKLYEASQAGVVIRLIIRGSCSLVPGVTGISDNITAISIVDKFLEHARVFIFANNGNAKYYISSADWMQRNLDFRSEVAAPVYSKELQQELHDIFELQWRDNVKARVIKQGDNNNHFVKEFTTSKNQYRAQNDIYSYLKKKNTV